MKIDRILFWGIIVALSFYVVCHLGFTNNTFENFVAGVNEYVETGGCYGNVKYDDSMKGEGIVNPEGHCAAGGKASSKNRCYADTNNIDSEIAPKTVNFLITNPITATEWEHQNKSK